MSNFHSTNVNNMNSLQHIRSPTLQHAFDSIRLTAQNTMSSNDIHHNSRHSSNPNNHMQTMNDRNGNNGNDTNISLNQSSQRNASLNGLSLDREFAHETNSRQNENEQSDGDAVRHRLILDSNSIREIDSNAIQHGRLERNTFRHRLTMDNETSRAINLNHIPQSLDNQFEREFACNVGNNTSRQNPIEVRELTITMRLCRNNKFGKRCDEKNPNDVICLNNTGFKFPVKFSNDDGAMLPFLKIRHCVQQLINENIANDDGIYPMHFLTG